jgi:CheY-like chemotaxis protein
LDVIDRQSHQLVRLVDDLLDVTRIEHGKIRLQRERLDLTALVAGFADDQRELFERNGIHFELDLGGENIPVSVDSVRIAQVVGNLLWNAAKFTPRGGYTTLRVRRVDKRWAEITVQDTGEGLAPEIISHLFEPFVQADRTLPRTAGGLGLGLALVKGLVELHGGSVAAQSAGPGKGATFSFRLPVERKMTERLALVPERAAEVRARRILVIEDNFDAAETMRELLELNAHEVEVAYSGPDGIVRARAFRPDVVLCDIGLPGMDGYQVARALRGDPETRATGLIALTGYGQPNDLDASRAAGFDLHLTKPAPIESLEASMNEAYAIALARAAPSRDASA